MKFRGLRLIAAGLVAFLVCNLGAAFAFQREFREYGGERPLPLPADARDPSEFVFGHLMYPSAGGRGFFGGGGRDWRNGGNGNNWTNDYPAADRHLMMAIRRLTFVQARSVEQPINLEDPDDVFNWPFLYAVRTTSINLTDEMIHKLRDYIDRGGFFVADDMWGPAEHQAIFDTIERLYPNRELVELGNTDAVMHSLFDLNDRYQIIGQWGIRNGFRPLDGVSYDPHWRGVFDEKGRMVIAIWLNNDTGDSWEWADVPEYPEHYSALGFRIMLNHITYAITH
ncbi:MAG: DUF4159 domain-containing protein [Acidobacteriota bacterium]